MALSLIAGAKTHNIAGWRISLGGTGMRWTVFTMQCINTQNFYLRFSLGLFYCPSHNLMKVHKGHYNISLGLKIWRSNETAGPSSLITVLSRIIYEYLYVWMVVIFIFGTYIFHV